MQLILYSRHACHLCEVMQAELIQFMGSYTYELELRDVDSRPEWREAFGLEVPVLTDNDGTRLSKYHLDESQLSVWLARQDTK